MKPPITPPTLKTRTASNTLALSDSLLMESQTVEREQSALIQSGDIQQSYQEAISIYVQAKHDQIEAIEDRLEMLISSQQAKLQQVQSAAPGLLTMPSTRKAWQSQVSDQSARLQSLNNRLHLVREIKDQVGLHGSKIEEMAAGKLQRENPDLVGAWIDDRETQRIRQLQLIQEKKKSQLQTGKYVGGQRLDV